MGPYSANVIEPIMLFDELIRLAQGDVATAGVVHLVGVAVHEVRDRGRAECVHSSVQGPADVDQADVLAGVSSGARADVLQRLVDRGAVIVGRGSDVAALIERDGRTWYEDDGQ